MIIKCDIDVLCQDRVCSIMFPRLPYQIKLVILTIVCIYLGLVFVSVIKRCSPKWTGEFVYVDEIGWNPHRVSLDDDSKDRESISTSPRPTEDFTVDPYQFNYILNEEAICQKKKNMSMLIYVHSKPNHLKKRLAIRETWANQQWLDSLNMAVVFFMGVSSETKTMERVAMESKTFGDIVQEDYMDSYRNLTFKAVSALKWIHRYCYHVAYLLKVDDDIFVNVFILPYHIARDTRARNSSRRLVLCHRWTRMKVVRNAHSKWFVPKSEFESDFYPVYCSGSAFVLSSDTAYLLLNASIGEKFFWVDDYFLTGILVRKAGLVPTQFRSVYVLNYFSSNKLRQENMSAVLFAHTSGILNMYSLWRLLVRSRNIIDANVFHWSVNINLTRPVIKKRFKYQDAVRLRSL